MGKTQILRDIWEMHRERGLIFVCCGEEEDLWAYIPETEIHVRL